MLDSSKISLVIKFLMLGWLVAYVSDAKTSFSFLQLDISM